MPTDQYHEPPEELSQEVRTFARLAASLQEEAEAIGWYEQRLSVERAAEARSIMEDAQEEEVKHLAMAPGSPARDQVFIEMSTAGPDVVREVQPAIERSGAKFIGCPVMGSTTAMEAGKAILFAAGDDAAIAKARPVLEALGEVRRMKDAESA